MYDQIRERQQDHDRPTSLAVPRWIAHRGAGKLAPENTLAAFRLGAQHGYRAFECDLKLSSDGIPILLHDAELGRTTSGKGLASALPWASLSRLDAGAWHSPACAGEPIPTLEGIARFCLRNGYALNIEIKPTPGDEPNTGCVVAAEAARLWDGAKTPPLLSSFSPEALAAAREAAPELPRALLIDEVRPNWIDDALSLGCVAAVTNYRMMDKSVVDRLHGSGLRALAYTVNDEGEARRLQALGIDGIITDAVGPICAGRITAPLYPRRRSKQAPTCSKSHQITPLEWGGLRNPDRISGMRSHYVAYSVQMLFRSILPLVFAISMSAFAQPQKPVRLIPIGDSITQGGKAGTKEYTYRWPLDHMLHDEGVCFDFVGSRRAGLDLDARWPDAWDDSHEGYYGAKTATVRDRIATTLPTLPAPDIALVDLGTNDKNGSITDDVISPLRDIVGLLRKANPHVKVLLAQIPSGRLHGLYLHFRMTMLAQELTRADSPVLTVDQYSDWKPEDQTFDGVHPNLRGQRWMAERWLSAMEPYLPGPRDDCRGIGDLSKSR